MLNFSSNMEERKIGILLFYFIIGLIQIKGLYIDNSMCKGVPPDEIVLLPHPENCSLYIQCANERPIEMPCPEKLHWNAEKKQCDFPEIANCKVEENTKSIYYTNCNDVPNYGDILLPNPENCNSYIQCVNKKPVVRQCPEGLHWSVNLNRCEWPDIANCKANICENAETNQERLLPNPHDCETFIQCVHQQPIILPCPEGLHWNSQSNICDWPEIANCEANKFK